MVRTLLSNKINALHSLVEEKAAEGHEEWQRSVQEMEEKNRIKDKNLLIDSSVVLTAVIIMFFVHSVPQIHLDLGWIAIIGAMALLLVADIHDLDHVLERVEWGTLMFFAALFILMEALAELGLIDWIGEGVGNLIKSVDEPYRLSVALLLILWVSAIASAFIDNIPFTTAMVSPHPLQTSRPPPLMPKHSKEGSGLPHSLQALCVLTPHPRCRSLLSFLSPTTRRSDSRCGPWCGPWRLARALAATARSSVRRPMSCAPAWRNRRASSSRSTGSSRLASL